MKMDQASHTVTLQIPLGIVKRGGRKEMQVPQDALRQRHPDTTLVKALARAFRWKRMLDSGEFATIADLARYESIARSYLTRVLQLTLLASMGPLAEPASGGSAGLANAQATTQARKSANRIPA